MHRPRSRTGCRAADKRDEPRRAQRRRRVGESDKAKIRRLEKELAHKERGARDLGKSAGLLRAAGGPVEVYAYIRAEKAADPEVKISADVPGARGVPVGLLRLAPTRQDQPAAGAAQDRVLLEEIRRDPRQVRLLRLTRGCTASCSPASHHVGRHRVARLMRLNGIQRAARQDQVATPRGAAGPAPRDHRPGPAGLPRRRPRRVLVHRRHPDPHRRRLAVGRGDPRCVQPRSRLLGHRVLENPKTALQRPPRGHRTRRPPPGASSTPTAATSSPPTTGSTWPPATDLKVSIGERKSFYDNAVMESWFASFKNEEIYPKGNPFTRAEARARLFHTSGTTTPSAGTPRWAMSHHASTKQNQVPVRETRASPTHHSNPGPKAATPTSTTACSSAPGTTTSPTTRASPPRSSPTATSASTAGDRPRLGERSARHRPHWRGEVVTL